MLINNLVSSLFSIYINITSMVPGEVSSGHDQHPPQPSLLPTQPYEARIICDVPPEEISFQAYEVFLALGHTVEKHSATINKDLAPYIQRVFNFDPLEGPFYFAMNVDDDLLKAIRSDPGVLSVACDIKIRLVEAIRGDDSDPHRDIRKGWFEDL
ncbi:hypothetical protein B0J14DRAFT_704396 [Halenospora varia]|nr:hypothetical protein B0J14DRAFT_704396 [Halenospora varia]